MRHVTDESAAPGWRSGTRSHRRRTPAPPRPPPRDDRPARHRAGHGLPVVLGPRDVAATRPTWTAPCMTTAPWSSSWRCAGPSSCSRATCCRRPGPAPSARVAANERARLAKDVGHRRPRRRRRRLARPRPRRGPRAPRRRARRPPRHRHAPGGADDRRHDGGDHGRPAGRDAAAHPLSAGADVVRGATPATGGSPGRSWTLMRHWLRRRRRARGPRPTATPSSPAAGSHVRPRHRGRPRLVARIDQGRSCGRRSPTLGPSRSRSTTAPPAGCCPTTRRRARPEPVGGAAARARPHRHGLEAPRLLPRPAPRRALRPQRQRRHDRRGSTAASSAAGSRTRPASSRCACWRRSPRPPAAPSTPRRPGSPPGWPASVCRRCTTRPRCGD